MENEFETIDSTNNETELENVTESQPEVDVDKLTEINSKLFARAKKAEEELKKLRSQPKAETKSVPSTNTYVSREELDLAILQTKNGYDEELIDTLKTISKGKGVSLIQAQEDPLFKLALEQKEAEIKKSKAQLGASRGSTSTPAKTVKGMTREEHIAYVKEFMSN